LILLISMINGYPSDVVNDQCVNYCSNDAVCLPTANNNNPQCYCLPGWDGERCDIVAQVQQTYRIDKKQILRSNLRVSPCSYRPDLCVHGMCFVNNSQLACMCEADWAGARCEEISDCKDYCYNNGLCEIINEAPNCNCVNNYGGRRCQSVKTTTTVSPPNTTTTTDVGCSYLPPDFCKNGGFCVVINNLALCQCPLPYTGLQCQTDPRVSPGPGSSVGPIIPASSSGPGVLPSVGVTCADGPCKNQGRCYPNGNSYVCSCGSLYTGTNCEYRG